MSYLLDICNPRTELQLAAGGRNPTVLFANNADDDRLPGLLVARHFTTNVDTEDKTF